MLPVMDQFMCNDESEQGFIRQDCREQSYDCRSLSFSWFVVCSRMLPAEQTSCEPCWLDLNRGHRSVVATDDRRQLSHEPGKVSVESIP